jgi:hypothetical protein
VVVNPASGPGPDSLPDANYTREIPRLIAFPNVRTVGYVSTNYTNRDLDLVLRDIEVYDAWVKHGLGMRGIFLDETPSLYEDASARFLETIAASIRSAASGFGTEPVVSFPWFFSFGSCLGTGGVIKRPRHASPAILQQKQHSPPLTTLTASSYDSVANAEAR